MLKDSAGRSVLVFRIHNLFWPILYWIALLYRRFFLKKVRIIVVIGSLGKSTTTSSIKYLLGHSVKTSFESNAFSAIAMQILSIKPGEVNIAIEVGIAKKGDMERYAQMIRPNIVVITSIDYDHSSAIGNLEQIAKEKSKIFNSSAVPEMVILNGDDVNVVKMVESLNTRKITFGFNLGNSYQCTANHLNWPDGCVISVKNEKINETFSVSLFGDKLVYCFLASLAVASELNIPLELIRKRISNIRPVNGRMQIVKLKSGAVLIRDEFKSTTASVNASLNFLDQIPAKRKIILLGSISHIVSLIASHPRHFYKRIGQKVGEIADNAFFVSSRDYEQVLASSAKKAGMNDNNIIKTKGDWTKIPKMLQADLSEGDVILITGDRLQYLERLSIILQGESVKCNIKTCDLRYIYCKDCCRLN